MKILGLGDYYGLEKVTAITKHGVTTDRRTYTLAEVEANMELCSPHQRSKRRVKRVQSRAGK